MRILRVTKEMRAKIREANRQSSNVIVVPFCIEGRPGIFVEYDHLAPACVDARLTREEHTRFAQHRSALGTVDSLSIIDAQEIPDRENRLFHVEEPEGELIEEPFIKEPPLEEPPLEEPPLEEPPIEEPPIGPPEEIP